MSSLKQYWRKDRTGSAWKPKGLGGRRGRGSGRTMDPNNVCTYEYMNKEKKINLHFQENPKLGPIAQVCNLNSLGI
jgi:hypothetical protein